MQLRGRPELSSFHKCTQHTPGGPSDAVRFSKMSFMVHCDFENGSQNKHYKYSFGRAGGGHNKVYFVYALDNVNNSGRPLTVNLLHGGTSSGVPSL